MVKKTRKRFDTGDYMAHGGKVELIFHGSSREIPMGEFNSAADAKRYVESSDWQRPYSIKKINKTPKVVRTQFEEEVFEYADGGETSKVEDLKKVIGKVTSENGSPTLRAKLIKVGTTNSIFESVKSPYDKNVDAKKIGVKYSVPNRIAWNSFFFGNGGQFADGGQLYSDKFTYNLIGEDIRKFKYRSFSEQIENANKFKVLMQKVYDAQPSDDRYPLEFIKAQARSKFSIVKDNGKNYLYGYMYKGSLTHFPFLDDKNFVEALKYVDRPAIRKLEDGGMTMAKGGETKPSLIPDYSKISSVEVSDIDRNDAPDYVDAYISYAEYDGEPMTEEQLEELNYDGDFVYSAVERYLYADGGKVAPELNDEKFIEEAVNYLNYNGFAEVVSDGKGGWLVSYLNEDDDYIDVEYDSQGIVYLALDKRFMADEDDYEDDDYEDDDYAHGGELTDAAYKKRMKMFGHTPYGKTKGKFKVTYNADGEPQTEIWESMEMAKDSAKRYSRMDDFADVKIFDESGKEIQFMAKGAKVKSRWIQDALTGNKGALRRTAKRKGLIRGDEKLSKSDLNKLEKMGGKTARRARLAETLIDFKK
jgi:hypothetical protein